MDESYQDEAMANGENTRPMRVVPSGDTRLGYLFWLSRPRYWHYLASPVILGLVYGSASVDQLLSPVVLAYVVYFLLPGNVFLYGVNDAFDRDTDRFNPKKADDGKEEYFRMDRTVIAAIVLSGVLVAPILLLTPSAVGVGALLGWLVLSVEYSAPPLRLKSIPLVDSISNGLYVLPGIGAYATVAGELPPLAGVVGFWLWTMGYHTFAAIPDIEPDAKAGVRTLATVLGERRSLLYCTGCWLAAVVAFADIHPLAGAIFLVYPAINAVIVWNDIDIGRAYWWLPTINAVVGIPLTAPGLWLLAG